MIGTLSSQGRAVMDIGWFWGIFSIIIVAVIAFYVLRSVGIYMLAKRQGLKYLYLAWIPFAWIYLAGKLAGDVSFFGVRFKGFAIVLTVVFCVTELITLTTTFLYNFPLLGYLLSGGEIYVSAGELNDLTSFAQTLGLKGYWGSTSIFVGNNFVFPYANVAAVTQAINALNIIEYVLSFANVVLTVFLYSALFKKYLPRHHLVATIFSAFGLFAPFIFAVRNNSPMNYAEYVRNRYANMYGNVYNQPNGMGNQNHNANNEMKNTPFEDFADKQSSNSSEPFEEFSDKKDSPFEEFDDKK